MLDNRNLITMANLINDKINEKKNEEIFIFKVADQEKQETENFIKALSKLNPVISTDRIKRYFNFDFNNEFFKNCVKWCDDQVEKARKYYD